MAEGEQQTVNGVRGHILFAFAVALALALAWRLRPVLELVYVSALFAVVLSPVVQRMMQWKLQVGKRVWSPSRPVAILILVGSAFVALALLLAVGLPPVAHDLQRFAQDLPQRLPALMARVKQWPIADKIDVDSLATRGENMAAAGAEYLLSSAPALLGVLADLATAFVLCIYFMLEGEYAYNYFLSFFPDGPRERLARTLLSAEVRMSKWLIGQGSLMLILCVVSTLVFVGLHVRYAVLLGLLMGLSNIIPFLGGTVTIILAAGAAALDSWEKMVAVLVFYFIYAQLESAYLGPRIMRSSVNLMGLATLIALLAGAELAGIVGALVAIPTAALVAVLVDEYMVQKQGVGSRK